MAFDQALADRIRTALAERKGIEERKMFGGICFLHQGNICVGVWKTALIARLGAEQAGEALREEHVKPFDVTGKPMKNWVLVQARSVADDDQVRIWVERALTFVETLPAK